MEQLQNQVNTHATTLASHDVEIRHVNSKLDQVAEDVAEIKKFVYQIHGGAKFAWIIAGAIGAFAGWVVNLVLNKHA